MYFYTPRYNALIFKDYISHWQLDESSNYQNFKIILLFEPFQVERKHYFKKVIKESLSLVRNYNVSLVINLHL